MKKERPKANVLVDRDIQINESKVNEVKEKLEIFLSGEVMAMCISLENVFDRIAFSLWVLLMPLNLLKLIVTGRTESWDKYTYKIRRWFYLRKK